ncbi:hypothetical protein TYRP_012217 [Tyrophagus putrescentiae]|nr:hypothetical protein TYRP_023335 [Tyrophagus putrescentiae]KAH9407400.1 hypothetical protein TYRP_012217 [Tyrophagus putrescentiae]
MLNRNKVKSKGIERKEVERAAQGEWARVQKFKDKGLGHGSVKRPAMMGAHWAAGRLSDRVTASTANQQLP